MDGLVVIGWFVRFVHYRIYIYIIWLDDLDLFVTLFFFIPLAFIPHCLYLNFSICCYLSLHACGLPFTSFVHLPYHYDHNLSPSTVFDFVPYAFPFPYTLHLPSFVPIVFLWRYLIYLYRLHCALTRYHVVVIYVPVILYFTRWHFTFTFAFPSFTLIVLFVCCVFLHFGG